MPSGSSRGPQYDLAPGCIAAVIAVIPLAALGVSVTTGAVICLVTFLVVSVLVSFLSRN